MSVRDEVESIAREVEARTGCPVHVSRDPSIGRMALVDLARGTLRLHRIRIQPAHGDTADYLIALQCGFILRKFGVPPGDRVDFAAAPRGRKEADKLVNDHYRGRGLPGPTLKGLRDQLFEGLMLQLASMPLALRVDAWIADEHAVLVEQQKVAIHRQLQENLGSLRPEIKKVAPDKIVGPSLAMNAAFAAFWSRRWGDPLISLPYRSANLGQPGLNLLRAFDETSSEPSHDRELIDAWARQLGLAGWYEWVPYKLDDA